MRIADVIGKATLSKSHPALQGATWLVAAPLLRAGLRDQKQGREEPLVVFDERGAGTGSLIAFSEGAEASAPFHPDQKPIDAYIAAILDTVDTD